MIVYVLTLLQQPSNDRDWALDNSIVPEIRIVGKDVSISGFRHITFSSGPEDAEDETNVNYSTLRFQIDQLREVWFVVQKFTALEGIAHNFLTFSYDPGDGPRYFSVSVEIRRERGESFSPTRGLYRQYELIYVVADERDEIGSRTVFRPNDRVYLYPVNATSEQVQSLFVSIAARMQALVETPEYYHSLLNNCTNNIVEHTYQLTSKPINWLNPQIVLPGFADRLAFSRGLIGDGDDDFETLRARCRIDGIARKGGITPDFSTLIRQRLDRQGPGPGKQGTISSDPR
ncbi:MAG: DUF4105 domain-containing protein [Planctomycetaceae bacterium]|nr:DUF4105 domain-containing protein [Planctomycetaceae bacterium]